MFLLFEAVLIAIFHCIYTSHHSIANSSSSSSSSYSYLKFTELCALFLCENNIQHHKIRSFVIFFCSSSFLILFSYCYVGGFLYRKWNMYTNYGVRMTTTSYSASCKCIWGFRALFSIFFVFYDFLQLVDFGSCRK